MDCILAWLPYIRSLIPATSRSSAMSGHWWSRYPKEEYLSGAPRPYQLFSHSDQIAQWQNSISTGPAATGWGGRIADSIGPLPGLPTVTALAGGAFTRGQFTSPLSVAPAPTALNQLLALNGFNTTAADQLRRKTLEYLLTVDRETPWSVPLKTPQQARSTLSQSLNSDPVLATVFPNTSLGNQLKQIAKLIRFNQTTSAPLSRQIFFCSLGGFDTHQNQVTTQSNL